MDKIEELLTRGVEKIYPSKETLARVLRSGKKIRLYQGFDPSMSNLHLGNMVGVLKLRQFQELGHEVIFLVGDFTGMIGDPTDKKAVRKLLTREQVRQNCHTWKKQAGKILNFSNKNPAKFMFNSTWLDKINFKDLIGLTSKFTVQQMIERDFFQKRIKESRPIFLHEFLYPIAQAIDSYKMNVDLEIGGSDQTFNMLCGRTLMAAVAKKDKFVLTTKLLVDVKGEKVGKTAGNALFLNTTPADMYGGIMSFPDEVLSLAFELLTQLPLQLIKALTASLSAMDLKKRLAFEIVNLHFSEKKAKESQKEFEKVFQARKTPDQLPEFKISKKSLALLNLLLETKLVSSKSEAKRLIRQKAVEINNQKVLEPQSVIKIKNGMVIRVGKRRFVKVLSS